MRSSQSLRFLYLMPAVWLGLSLTACNPSPLPKNVENNATDTSTDLSLEAASEPVANAPSGKKLTELSGQATLPYDNSIDPEPVPEHAKAFIGRFHTNVKCDDGFIPCQKGDAEFILNMLPDGSVHRSVVQFGKVFTEKTNIRGNINYRRDTWTINESHTELVVHRKEGLTLYYKVIDPNHILMDLDKITDPSNVENQELFSKGYPRPRIAYELKKDQN